MRKGIFFVSALVIIVIIAIYLHNNGKSVGKTPLPEQPVQSDNVQNQEKSKDLSSLIKVRGKNIVFDVPPVLKEGRTLIPVRAVLNGLGAEVEWNSAAQIVTITRADKKIILNMQSGKAYSGGRAITLDVPAQIINDRTYVPLRFVAQTLGEKVEYIESTGEINIGN